MASGGGDINLTLNFHGITKPDEMARVMREEILRMGRNMPTVWGRYG